MITVVLIYRIEFSYLYIPHSHKGIISLVLCGYLVQMNTCMYNFYIE